jgi:hypothetical protein
MMANNQNFDLKVSFSADLGNTGVVFRQVHQNIAQSFGNLGSTITGTGAVVKKGLDDVGTSAGNNAQKHIDANKQIGDSTISMSQQLQNGFNGIQTAFGKLGMAMAAVGSVIGGGNWLLGMITSTQEGANEIYKLSKMLNISLEDATMYKEALEDIGLETDVLVRASRLLIRQIGQDATVFKQYGITLQDTEGNFKSTENILTEVVDKYRDLGNTVEANTFGNKIFSRSFSEVQGITRLNTEVLKEAIARNKEYNLVLTVDQLKALRAYHKQQEDANDVMQEFAKTITFYIMPMMKEFLKGLEANRDTLRDLAELTRGFILACIALGKTIAVLTYFMRYGWEATASAVIFAIDSISLAFSLLTATMLGDVGKQGEIQGKIIASFNKFKGEQIGSLQDFVKKATDSGAGFMDMLQEMDISERILKRGGKEAPLDKSGNPAGAEERMKQAMAKLASEEVRINKETIGNTIARNNQLLALYTKYYSELSSVSKFGEALVLQAQTELQGKLTSLGEQGHQRKLALKEAEIKQVLDIAEQEFAEAERQEQRKLTLGLQTEAQTNQNLTKILNDRIMAYLNYFNELRLLNIVDKDLLLKLKDEENSKLKLLLAQRGILYEKEGDKLTMLNRKMSADFVNAFQSGFKGILSGTKSFTEGIRSMWSGLLDIFDEIIWGMVRQWILGEEAKTTASAFGFELIAGLTTAFHALMSALGWESVGEKVLQEETKGTATIWGEWGAYPPIAVALTAGLIGILAGLAFSAEGGWDSVPFDGAMTSLHKGEMVLPQNLAEKVRNMTETKPSQNITYNITAMDAQSFKSFASKNKSILFNTHNSALRDGLQYGVRGV